MKRNLGLRYTLIDQYGSRAVIEGQELDRAAEHWGLQRTLESFFDDIAWTKCPSCATTLEDAIETGLMGCPACYEFIYPEYRTKISKIMETSPNSGHTSGPNQVS